MASFRGVDYLHIDDLFNEEEELVRQTVRQFVEARLIPVIRDCSPKAMLFPVMDLKIS
jgi:hypothetical protein